MNANKMSEEITSLKIEDIFNSVNVQYKIPIYQRNYAWKEPQIRQLIQDIYDYYLKDNRENENEIKKYYIGTLVVRPDKEKNTFEVIDGQQRLTTLSMLVAYLNNIVKAPNNTKESEKTKLENTITFQCRQVSTNSLNKIWGKNSSDDYEATDPILAGYQILKKSFEDIVGKTSEDGTNEKYLAYLLEHVIIYRIPVPEDTDLNHYFEIMNTRGEQLEKHEILKAIVLMIPGILLGLYLFYNVNYHFLLYVYGTVILVIAVKNFFTRPLVYKMTLPLVLIIMTGAGIMHSLFVSSGAFMVIYAMHTFKDKSEFRATMVVLGAFLNILLLFQEIFADEITFYNSGLSVAVLIPSLLAIFIGNRLHKKLSGSRFFLLANIILLISGLVCFFKA